MIRRLRLAIACVVSFALLAAAGCSSGPTKEQTGTVLGGVVGGVLGSQVGSGRGRTAATILGAIAGGVLGGSVGRSMGEADRDRTAHALETTRPGESTRWKSPDTGRDYTVTPTRAYNTSGGSPCREYRIETVIDGRPQAATGNACREPEGNWRAQG